MCVAVLIKNMCATEENKGSVHHSSTWFNICDTFVAMVPSACVINTNWMDLSVLMALIQI